MAKPFVQPGRNARKIEAYSVADAEALRDVATTLGDRRVPGNGLRSNRWMGRVQNIRRTGAAVKKDLCNMLISGAFRRRIRATHNVADILRTGSRQGPETHPSRAMRELQHGHQDTRQAVLPAESRADPKTLLLPPTQLKPSRRQNRGSNSGQNDRTYRRGRADCHQPSSSPLHRADGLTSIVEERPRYERPEPCRFFADVNKLLTG